jgi:hypothetical protein
LVAVTYVRPECRLPADWAEIWHASKPYHVAAETTYSRRRGIAAALLVVTLGPCASIMFAIVAVFVSSLSRNVLIFLWCSVALNQLVDVIRQRADLEQLCSWADPSPT